MWHNRYREYFQRGTQRLICSWFFNLLSLMNSNMFFKMCDMFWIMFIKIVMWTKLKRYQNFVGILSFISYHTYTNRDGLRLKLSWWNFLFFSAWFYLNHCLVWTENMCWYQNFVLSCTNYVSIYHYNFNSLSSLIVEILHNIWNKRKYLG